MNSQFIHSLNILDKEKKLPSLKKPLNQMEPPKKKSEKNPMKYLKNLIKKIILVKRKQNDNSNAFI